VNIYKCSLLLPGEKSITDVAVSLLSFR